MTVIVVRCMGLISVLSSITHMSPKNCSKWMKMKKTCVLIILMMKYLIYQKRNHLDCLNSLTGLNRCIVYRDIWRVGAIPISILGLRTGKKGKISDVW